MKMTNFCSEKDPFKRMKGRYFKRMIEIFVNHTI